MKNIIIFGATGAIGRSIAHQLHSEGASLFLAARDDEECATLAAQLGARHGHFSASDEASISAIVAKAQQEGPITGLIWAVGSILLKPLAKLTANDFDATFQVNVTSAALAIQAAAPSLKQAQGSVLLFSSVAASQGFTNHAAIGAAKAGVEGLAKALAAEFSPDVRVNVIAPSLSLSKMAEPLLANDAMAKGLAQMHPLGRLGRPDDFSALVSLLLDAEKSGWITGTVLAVDGGRGSLAVNARSR